MILHSLSTHLVGAAAVLPSRGILRVVHGTEQQLLRSSPAVFRWCRPYMTAPAPSVRKGGKQNEPEGPKEELSADELMAARLQKVKMIRDAGKEPFGYSYNPTHTAAELKVQFAELPAGEEDADSDVAMCGRVLTRRIFGKLAFFTMQVSIASRETVSSGCVT